LQRLGSKSPFSSVNFFSTSVTFKITTEEKD
jgi:hypothetical protein